MMRPWDPPGTIETELFTELPAALRRPGPRGDRNFLEGPSFDSDGYLHCVDVEAGRIYRISPQREWEVVAQYDGQPNGLKLHRDGRIFVADRQHGILTVEPSSGRVAAICEGPREGTPFRGLNDLIFSAGGELYFTDQGRSGLQDPTGCVYRIDAEGNPPERVIGNVPSPNGLVFNLRQTELFVAVTRANAVWRVELADDARRAGLFVQLASPGPDGLALDSEGNVVVAQPTGGAVWVFSKRGAPLFYLPACRGDMPTNIAYGGPDMRDLYITESRSNAILRARLPIPGVPMFGQT